MIVFAIPIKFALLFTFGNVLAIGRYVVSDKNLRFCLKKHLLAISVLEINRFLNGSSVLISLKDPSFIVFRMKLRNNQLDDLDVVFSLAAQPSSWDLSNR